MPRAVAIESSASCAGDCSGARAAPRRRPLLRAVRQGAGGGGGADSTQRHSSRSALARTLVCVCPIVTFLVELQRAELKIRILLFSLLTVQNANIKF